MAPIISTAKALKDEVFPPIKFIVKSYLVEGATILAGRPKIGKSWLALDWSVAVARGGFCFGDVNCKEGDVLYIALEDNKRRLKSRLAKILGLIGEWPEKLEYATEWPRANVDVLETFRSRARGNDNYYASDYETTKALQAIASETSIAILIIHHVRKGAADNDPIDKISGTLGLSGGSDSLLILDRDSNGAALYGRVATSRKWSAPSASIGKRAAGTCLGRRRTCADRASARRYWRFSRWPRKL